MSHVAEGTLHAYLDGELPAAEQAAVEAHVAQCAECRAQLAEERALVARANQVLGFAAPRDRPAPAFDQIGRRPRRASWHVRLPVAWAASIALALGLGYYLHVPDTTPSTSAPQNVAVLQDRLENRTAPPAPEPRAEVRAARRPASAPAPQPATDRQAEKSNVATGEVVRRDSPPATGAVAIVPQAGYSSADRVAARSAAAPSSALRMEEQPGNQWPFSSRDRAREILGAAPVGVPGLSVRAIRRNPAANGGVVVEQELDAARVIQVFQRRVDTERDTRSLAREKLSAAPSSERLARFVGTLRVEIAGPLPQDSLNRLLEQVQPLP